MGGWRVHTGFTVGWGSLGEEEGEGVSGSCWLHCRLRIVGSCWFHFRLKLCRMGKVEGGGGSGVASFCWFHCRLRLCRTAGSCWIHCRLRLSREGEGWQVLAGFTVG